jgi:hypothetical protein
MMSRSRRIELAVLCAVLVAAGITAVLGDLEWLRAGRASLDLDRPDAGQGWPYFGVDAVRRVAGEEPRPEGGAAPAASPDCVLTVLNDLGAPTPDAHVALFRNDGLVATGRTDSDGTVELAGSTEPCSLAVFPMGAGVFVQQLAAADGQVTARLPQGAVVSGRVEIEGAESRPVRLQLLQEDLSKLPVWPAVVDRWIRGVIGHQPWLMTCVADPSGAFRFSGLPSNTPLIVTVSQPPFFLEAPEPPGVRIEAPRSDLVIVCRRRPHVAGRVVASGTRQAAPGAWVDATFSFQTGPPQRALVRADESGAFWLWIPKANEGDAPTGATVQVSTARNSGMRVHEFPPSCFTPGQRLGDLELGATRLVPYRVTNPAGDPIAGTLVRARDRGQAIESVADGDGKGVIEAPIEQTELTVGALGFKPVTVPAPEGPAEELRIVLEAACLLRIDVQGQPETEGRSTDSVVIEVQSDEPLFEGAPETWSSWERSGMLVGQAWSVEPSDEHGRTFTFRARQITLSTVRPNVPVRITVRDALSGARTARTVVLAPGERKSIELRLNGKLRTVAGRVIAADGSPVYWGLVHLMPMSRREEDWISRDTARDGSFAFECVLADRALVAVEGTSWIQEVLIAAEGLRLEVRLEEELEAEFRVIDHENRPVGGVEVSVTLGAFLRRDRSDDEGVARIRPVPSGEAIVEARHGSVRTRATVRIPGPETTLVLPPFGSVTFESERAIRRIRLESLSCADVVELGDAGTGMSGVIPGRYRARIECWTDDEMRDSISLEREVTVKQGETTCVKVGK